MHLMLDIETLGVKPGCVVMQVALVRFDHSRAFAYAHKSLFNIDLMDQLGAGLVIDPDTLQWWRDKDKVVRDKVMNAEGSRYRLTSGLQDMGSVIAEELANPRFRLWANPDCFDLPILAALFHSRGMDVPWPRRQTADARTFLWAAGFPPELRTKSELPHYALDDAIAQARDVIRAAETLKIDLR